MNQQELPSGSRLRWLGIGLVILGALSVIAPMIAGTSVVIMIGIILLIAGIGQVISGLRADGFKDKVMPLILGVITTLAGLGVIAHPLVGLGYLTLLLVVFFIIEGVWKIIASLRFRPTQGWIWLLLSGVLSLVLAYLIGKQWPLSGLWAVGVLVGVNLLTTGMSILVLSSAVKAMGRAVSDSKGPQS